MDSCEKISDIYKVIDLFKWVFTVSELNGIY